jgi:hypothetical protein
VQICGNPAEFWLWRLFAFELQRRDTYIPKPWQPLSVLIAAEQALASRV